MAAVGKEINLHWPELAPIFAKILAGHSERKGCVFRGNALSEIREGLAELVEAQEIHCTEQGVLAELMEGRVA